MVKVGLFLADGFEEIEGLTSVDAMRRAGFEVTTISIMKREVINGSHGIKVYADTLFEDVDDFKKFDALVLPGGGIGTQNLKAHEGVRKEIVKKASEGKLVAAICAAPTVLASVGLLDKKRATCYPGCESEFNSSITYTAAQVEEDGMVITGNGMAAALPFAFAIIKKLGGEEPLDKVKKGVAYLG